MSADLPLPCVFVYGALRSGNTMFRLMLGGHEAIAEVGENDWLLDYLEPDPAAPDGWRYRKADLAVDRVFRGKQIPLPEGLDGPALFRHLLVGLQRGEGRVMAITLHRNLDRLLAMLPGALLIHLLRDPRDVARSCIGMGWAGNLYFGVDGWIATERQWDAALPRLHPGQMMELTYEGLVAEPETELRRVCRFLGQSYSAAMLAYDQSSSYDRPDPSLVQQWRRKSTPQEIALVEGKAGPLMQARGYAPTGEGLVPGLGLRLRLAVHNKVHVWRMAGQRYGYWLILSEKLTRRLGLHAWNRSIRLRIGNLTRAYLKQAATDARRSSPRPSVRHSRPSCDCCDPMTTDLALVLAILVATVVMFALNRPRMDVVAVMAMAALPFTGVISVGEALSGFADPNVILIAALFVVGEALVRTGVTQRIGDWVAARAGRSEARLIFFLMVGAASLSSIMSSTGVVAIFIPMILRIARTASVAAGRLMMPLSMAALISGMLTLIGTPPNLIVHGELVRRGEPGFGFFDFTPFGLPILVLAILYMIAVRRFLGGAEVVAPDPARRNLADWVADYGLPARQARLRLAPGSPLAGQPLAALDLRAREGVNILAVEHPTRQGVAVDRPRAGTVLHAGDILLVDIMEEGFDLDGFARRWGLSPEPLSDVWFTDRARELGLAEAMIPPTSPLVGQTVTGARIRSRHDLAVIGLRHGARPVAAALRDEKLRPGDTLLLMGPWRAIRRAQESRRELLLLDLPGEAENVAPEARRAPLALLAVGLMVVAMVTGILPNVHAALLCCLLLGLFRCIDMTGAYGSMHWKSLVLIVGMLPFSIALQRTGGVDLAAQALVDLAGAASPRVLLAAIFITTSVFSLFISNTATAVLMAPVAMAVAESLGISPYPFAMTVALAASAAFMTPVSSPVNTLVLGPGGYRFIDFVRIGVPFTLITLVVVIAMVPIVLPF